jgi:peptidyl-prolyl isomerase D
MKGLRYVAEHPVEEEGDNKETIAALKELRIQFHLNLALVQLRTENYQDAIKSASNALELELSDKDRAKSYYRRGQAYSKTKDEALAIEDLKKASELNPEDAGILHELEAARRRVRERREKERKAYAKMFS